MDTQTKTIQTHRRVNVFKNSETKELDYKGTFHQFGVSYDEYESGPAPYTVAIIEKDDGTITMVPTNLIQFTKKEYLT